VFGKIKSFFRPPPVKQGAASCLVRDIAVPQTAVEAAAAQPAALVQATVNFVNALTGEAHYELGEIPAEAVQAYFCDYYLAQVNNGGHSQFVHNARMDPVAMDAIDTGLHAMNASELHAIFREMLDWASEHPQDAARQTGFEGGRAPELDVLDKRFYAAEAETPMTTLSAQWLLALKKLHPVPDGELAQRIADARQMNLHLETK